MVEVLIIKKYLPVTGFDKNNGKYFNE